MKNSIILLIVFILINSLKANTWDFSSVPLTSIKDLTFLNSNTGFIIGYNNSNLIQVCKTVDKGRNWTNVPSGWYYQTYQVSCSVDFVDENHGWAYYGHQLWRTTNGGTFWQYYSLPGFNVNSSACKIRFADVNNGYALFSYDQNDGKGVTVIKITANGGNIYWSALNNQFNNSNWSHAELTDININTINQNNICVVGFAVYAPTGDHLPKAFVTDDGFVNSNHFWEVTGYTLPNAWESRFVRFIPGSISDIRSLTENSVDFIDLSSHSIYHNTSLYQYAREPEGMSFSTSNYGIVMYDHNSYITTDGGTSFTTEGFSNNDVVQSEMNSFGEVAYQGGNGKIFVRNVNNSFNTNFDWQVNPYPYQRTTYLDGNPYLTPITADFRGGTCNLSVDSRFLPPGNPPDTTAQFYYWVEILMEAQIGRIIPVIL